MDTGEVAKGLQILPDMVPTLGVLLPIYIPVCALLLGSVRAGSLLRREKGGPIAGWGRVERVEGRGDTE